MTRQMGDVSAAETYPPDPGGVQTPSGDLFKEITYSVVVKKCLVKSLNANLSPRQRKCFLDLVNRYTEIISRMARRASLLLLYYIIRTYETNQCLPNLEDVQDSYWHDWLRVGLEEFGNIMPTQYVIPFFEEVRQWMGTSLDCGDVPIYFDRIVGHAAIGFKTAVINTQKVHLIAKLARLCKHVADGCKVKGLRGGVVMKALRSGEVPLEWPAAIRVFIHDVRNRLSLQSGVFLHDNFDISFSTIMNFNWWMQQRFEALGQRRIMLSPVYEVSRMHIRLDATSLYLLAHHCTSPPHMVETPPKHVPSPTTKQFPNRDDFQRAKHAREEYNEVLAVYNQTAQEHRSRVQKFEEKFPSYSNITKNKPADPRSVINKELPVPSIGKRPKEMTDDEGWDSELRERRKRRDDRLFERAARRDTVEFRRQLEAYETYEAVIHSHAMKLFKPFEDKKSKLGWKAAVSIATDGVSVSILYEKTVRVPILAEEAAKRRIKKTHDADLLPPYDDYDPTSCTVVDDVLVLGVDPGRTHLATVVCIDSVGKKHVWRLSKGRYYTEGGILSENCKQSKRYECLKAHFARMMSGGGALRTSRSVDVRRYMSWYSRFSGQWLEVALRRCESRSTMQRYIAKKKVMATFWSEVRKDAEKLLRHKGQHVEVAYGSAVQHMKATGRGETATPVGETYRSCQLVFGKVNVSPEWEHLTTQVAWETKERKEIVYKRYDSAKGTEILCHTSRKCAPEVAPDERYLLQRLRQSVIEKNKRRRGGSTGAPDRLEGWKTGGKEEGCSRYPECRGLRFCPKRRMYYDRDEGSARAIAGLRCLRLQGLGRPSCFSHRPHQESQVVGRGADEK